MIQIDLETTIADATYLFYRKDEKCFINKTFLCDRGIALYCAELGIQAYVERLHDYQRVHAELQEYRYTWTAPFP